MLNSLDHFLLQLRSAAAVASAGVLCLSLAACGSDSADPEDSPSFSAAKESAPEADQATSSADGNTEEKPAQKTTTVVETPPEKKQDESAPSRGQDNGGSSECSSDNDESAYKRQSLRSNHIQDLIGRGGLLTPILTRAQIFRG